MFRMIALARVATVLEGGTERRATGAPALVGVRWNTFPLIPPGTSVPAKIAQFAARTIGFAIIGLSLYLWIEILGGFSFYRGLVVLGLIFAVVGLTLLPRKSAWVKASKAAVLVVTVILIVKGMLPIETTAGWLLSILIAGVCCLIGYLMLFEDFF